MPLPGAAQELFTTNNSSGTCAAFSQTWLVLSLIQGKPLEKGGIVQSQGLMKDIQDDGSGGPSLDALKKNGVAVSGSVIVLNNAAWSAIFQRLTTCPSGYYYITMKSPHHANACCISNGEFYYLEPEVGCYKFSDAGSLTSNLPGWYQSRTGQSTNTEFKIYPVSPL
jgi:hypothetical protein